MIHSGCEGVEGPRAGGQQLGGGEAQLASRLAAMWLRRQEEHAEHWQLQRTFLQRMMEQHEAVPSSFVEQHAQHHPSSRQYASATSGPLIVKAPAAAGSRAHPAAGELALPRGAAYPPPYGGKHAQAAPGLAMPPRPAAARKCTLARQAELLLGSPTGSSLSHANTQCPSPMSDPSSRPGSSGNLQGLTEAPRDAAGWRWSCAIQHPSAQSRANGQNKKAYKRRRRTENPGEPEVHAATTFWALYRYLFSAEASRPVSPYEFHCRNERLLTWTRRCPVGAQEDRFPEEIAAVAAGLPPDDSRKPSPMPPKPKRHQVMLDSQSFFVQPRTLQQQLMDNQCCQVIAGYIAFFGEGYLEQGVIGNMLSEQPGCKEVAEHVCPKILTDKGDRVHKESTGSLISFLMGEEGKKWFSVAPGMNGRYFICNRPLDLLEKDAMLALLGEYNEARRAREEVVVAEARARGGGYCSPFSSTSFASFSWSFDDKEEPLSAEASSLDWPETHGLLEAGAGEVGAGEGSLEESFGTFTCRSLFGEVDEGAGGWGDAPREGELDDMYSFLHRKKAEFLNPRSTWFSRHFGEPR